MLYDKVLRLKRGDKTHKFLEDHREFIHKYKALHQYLLTETIEILKEELPSFPLNSTNVGTVDENFSNFCITQDVVKALIDKAPKYKAIFKVVDIITSLDKEGRSVTTTWLEPKFSSLLYKSFVKSKELFKPFNAFSLRRPQISSYILSPFSVAQVVVLDDDIYLTSDTSRHHVLGSIDANVWEELTVNDFSLILAKYAERKYIESKNG